jgi:hypothetical protein
LGCAGHKNCDGMEGQSKRRFDSSRFNPLPWSPGDVTLFTGVQQLAIDDS